MPPIALSTGGIAVRIGTELGFRRRPHLLYCRWVLGGSLWTTMVESLRQIRSLSLIVVSKPAGFGCSGKPKAVNMDPTY